MRCHVSACNCIRDNRHGVRQRPPTQLQIHLGQSFVGIAPMKRREYLGNRKNARVELERPGFVIPAPDAPWIQCKIVDISDSGVCIDVGALVVPDTFGLALMITVRVLVAVLPQVSVAT
jgi:hypothetical protein